MVTLKFIDIGPLELITFATLIPGVLLPCLFIRESPLLLLQQNKLKALESMLLSFSDSSCPGSKEEISKFVEKSADWHTRQAEGSISPLSQGGNIALRSPLKTLFTNGGYLLHMLGLALLGSYPNIVYFAMYMNLQDIGTSSMTLNGILLSTVGLLANLAMIPFLSKMKGRKWSNYCQIIMLIGTGLLGLKSVFMTETSKGVELLQAFLTTAVVGGSMFVMYMPYYLYLSELFPVDLRGSANSVVSLSFNVLATATPFFCRLATDLGLHFLVGCSLVGVCSVVVTFFLKETLP